LGDTAKKNKGSARLDTASEYVPEAIDQVTQVTQAAKNGR